MKNLNAENQDRTITITLANGKTAEGKILFSFEANGDDFVLYELDAQCFAAKVQADGSLSAVEADEWKLVEEVYQQFQDEYEDN